MPTHAAVKPINLREFLSAGQQRYTDALKVLDDAERLAASGEQQAALRAFTKVVTLVPETPQVLQRTPPASPALSRIGNIGKGAPTAAVVLVDDQYEV